MKRSMTICLVCVLLATAASQGMTVNFDENGNGNIDGITPLVSGGGGTNGPLYYVLPFMVVEGDVLVNEPIVVAAIPSDLLRFIDDPTGAALSRVYVYSERELDGETDLADTGIPTDFMNNLITKTEQGTENGWSGLNDYTPQFIAGALSEPGYISGVTYNFTSDVPEPATICMLGIGGLLLGRNRKFNKK